MRKINEYIECPFDNFIIQICEEVAPAFKMLKMTPNIITTISLIFGILSYKYICDDKFKIASLLFLVAYFFDCLDGYYARQYDMETHIGDYYDHFSDITKIVIIIYAIYAKRPDLFTFLNIIIVISLFYLSLVHLGCQEKYYENVMSPSLECLKILCPNKKMIKYTKYFGTGTFMLIISLIIFNL